MPTHRTASEIRKAIVEAGLGVDRLAPRECKAIKAELRQRFGISKTTLDWHIREVRADRLDRLPRADRGRSRSITDEQRAMLTELAVARNRPKSAPMTDKTIYGAFCATYSDARISYDTLRRELDRIKQHLQSLHVATPQLLRFAYPNDRWETDISTADFFVSDPRLGDTPKRPQLWSIIDCCSRAIAWACYTVRGDSIAFGHMLLNAMKPKDDHDNWPICGTPRELCCDWGKVFKGEHAKRMLAQVGIGDAPARPFRPEDKGRQERWYRTCHTQFEALQPGACGPDNTGPNVVDPAKTFRCFGTRWFDPRPYVHGDKPRPLLDLDEANAALHRWITRAYHCNEHRGLRGNSPLATWLAKIEEARERARIEGRGDPLNHPPVALMEEVFCLLRVARVVRRGQVTVRNLSFHAPELADYERLPVEVLFSPDDATRVYVKYEGQRVAEAKNIAEITVPIGQDSFRMTSSLAQARRKRKQELEALPRRVNSGEAAELITSLQEVAYGGPVISPLGSEESRHPDFRGKTDAEILASLNMLNFVMDLGDGEVIFPSFRYKVSDYPSHLRDQVRPRIEEFEKEKEEEWARRYPRAAAGGAR